MGQSINKRKSFHETELFMYKYVFLNLLHDKKKHTLILNFSPIIHLELIKTRINYCMRVSLGLTYSRKAAKKKLAIVKKYKFKPSVVKKVNRLIFF